MLESLCITSKADPFVVDFRSTQVVHGSMWCLPGRDIRAPWGASRSAGD